jgi:nicotinamidase-related amidase
VVGHSVRLRSRSANGDLVIASRHDWDPANTAVVICDMWDTTHCISAARRVVEMAPRVNEVASVLRAQGALIIHAPADCMDYYANTPARERARRAPRLPTLELPDFNDWDASREAPLPPSLAEVPPCSCEPGEPCIAGGSSHPWTHQIDSIEVSSVDAITEYGEELLTLLEQRAIQDVLVMGVHANRCVLGRPYGIRQLVYWGKRPVLCRDLTDSYHRDPRGHLWGNEQMIAHIERYWCPTVASDQLVGGAPFQWPAP